IDRKVHTVFKYKKPEVGDDRVFAKKKLIKNPYTRIGLSANDWIILTKSKYELKFWDHCGFNECGDMIESVFHHEGVDIMKRSSSQIDL
ncbi:15122_t:CDS:1, partial [Gigaspora rosea]